MSSYTYTKMLKLLQSSSYYIQIKLVQPVLSGTYRTGLVSWDKIVDI